MESGALSAPEFAGFSDKVVLYLNIMSKVEGHADDSLMYDLGYRGHPTLAFMNAKGEVLGRPLERTVASFDATLVAIADYAKLEKRLEDGEDGLEYQRFLLERLLGKLRGDEMVRRGKALRDLDADQQLVVDRILIGAEVDDLILMSLNGAEGVAKAGKRMREILESGVYPDLVKSANAWSVLSRYGTQIEDADLLEVCSKGLADNFPKEERMISWSKSLAKQAAALRAKP